LTNPATDQEFHLQDTRLAIAFGRPMSYLPTPRANILSGPALTRAVNFFIFEFESVCPRVLSGT